MKTHLILIVAALNTWLRNATKNEAQRTKNSPLLCAANEELSDREISIANGDGDGEATFQADADSLFIPYGNYPHKVGLQKFDKASADAMAAAWNTAGDKVRRLFKPVPVYIGHPDVPALRQFYPDTKAYGWVEGMSAENEGLRMPVKWTAAGREMVENGHYKFYSPFWDLKQVPGGLAPVRMKSIGLTNNNNIPVPALANETAPVALPSWLTEILGMGADATEEAAKTALAAKMDQAGKAQDLADSHAKLDKKYKEDSDAHEKLSKAQTEHEKAMGAVKAMAANERAARVKLELAPLIASAKVVEGEREKITDELLALENEADLTSRIVELGKRAPQLKTKAVTENLGGAKIAAHAANEAEQRSHKIREAVDVETKILEAANINLGPVEKYAEAWRRAEKKDPQLFTNAPAI